MAKAKSVADIYKQRDRINAAITNRDPELNSGKLHLSKESTLKREKVSDIADKYVVNIAKKLEGYKGGYLSIGRENYDKKVPRSIYMGTTKG